MKMTSLLKMVFLTAFHSSSDALLLSRDSNIDIVIPASCEEDRNLIGDVGAMVERDRDNNELTYTLRAIKKNAPWVHHIYVLQNPHCEAGWKKRSLPEPEKTTWVDRCTLFPDSEKKFCPTRNSFAVMTVVHRVEGLADRFIYVEDDNLAIKPLTKNTFYKNGLPKCHKSYRHVLYSGSQMNTGLQSVEIPATQSGDPHAWMPLSKNVASGLEAKYPKWFSFVRSHWNGRYSSELNEFGTTRSDNKNSLEEDLAPIWWAYMNENKLCSEIGWAEDKRLYQDGRIGSWHMWYSRFADPTLKILNINDDMNTKHQGVYKKQLRDGRRKLEEAFPKELLAILELYFPQESSERTS